jgi:TrmH family RNA methyltransferase
MIVSRQNQKIKDIRRLKRCKGDRSLLEGDHLIVEAIGSGLALEYVLITPEFSQSLQGSALAQSISGVDIFEVDAKILESIADADSPRGVLAVASLPRLGVEAVPNRNEGLFLFVDGIQNPGNLGALARSAEAFSARAIVLSRSCVHPNHPRALRASAGSLLRIPVAMDVEPDDLSMRLDRLETHWLALVPEGGISIDAVREAPSYVLAVGAEGQGLSEKVERSAHQRVTIPIEPSVDSLNATVATSIALYELRRLL